MVVHCQLKEIIHPYMSNNKKKNEIGVTMFLPDNIHTPELTGALVFQISNYIFKPQQTYLFRCA